MLLFKYTLSCKIGFKTLLAFRMPAQKRPRDYAYLFKKIATYLKEPPYTRTVRMLVGEALLASVYWWGGLLD